MLGLGREFACVASDDAGIQPIQSPSAVEIDFVSADDEAEWKTTPSVDRTDYGRSIASAGNVDNYPGDDVLVGAPKDDGIDGSGAAYLYLSMGGGLYTAHAWAAGGGEHAVNFGSAVAGAGDVNGDGLDDAIIADDNHKAYLWIKDKWQWTQAGGAFVYEGIAGVGLSEDPIWSYIGTVQAGKFASAVAGAGDVNGDGVDDIVVGASLYTDATDNTQNSEGAIYVFYGHEGSGPSTEPDWLIDSDQPGALLGWAVSAAGDVDGDGYDDLIASAPFYLNPETGVQEGAVFLFLGRAPGEPLPTSVADAAWVAYGGQGGSWFGYSVAGAGHVNDDGHPDVVVSTPYYDRPSDGAEAGAAFAFCGNGSTLGSEPCWVVYGGQPGGQFGYSVAGAGHVNDDRFDEVIVGARYHHPDSETGKEGAVFLYFGSEAGLPPWAGWKAGGDKATTEFGTSVGSAGDVNGDGIDGILVGAPRYFWDEKNPYGRAYCFYGPLDPGEPDRVFLPLILRNSP